MITCDLNGRMGNQMFQIAATIGTAIRHNVLYSIPARTIDMNKFKDYFNHFIEHNPIGRIITHTEQKNEYAPIPYSTGTTLKLNGYYQSYKYFEHCKKQIIEAFGFSYNQQEGKGIVSIHVRRGDYTTLDDFNVLENYYYYQAIKYFIKKGYYKFIVYSDDIEWCYQYISPDVYKGCLFYYGDGTPQEDMQQMSLCEHNIIANSSFSWWGAWLNQNPNKIVVAPQTWFKGVNKDLLPKEWIILK